MALTTPPRPCLLGRHWRLGGAALASVALLPQAECIGTIQPCPASSAREGEDEAWQVPGLSMREVEWMPSIPLPGTHQAARITVHRPESLDALDLSGLKAKVRVSFCNREDDCLLIYEKEAPLCEFGNVSKSACSRLEPGEDFVAEPSWHLQNEVIRGGYSAEVRIEGDSNEEVACYRLRGVIVAARIWWNKVLDWRDAIVAFAVAASSSRALGRAFPKFSNGLLPQISGFLIIGVVVGPYVTNLVNRYCIFLMGTIINRISLAFIAGAAGAEIFLPELRDLIGPMLIQVAVITVFTMFICTVGLWSLASSGMVALPVITNQDSFAAQGSICLLAAALMTARSPASVIAVITEMNCGHMKIAKVILGITVLGDVVVLVVFALCMNLVRVTTEGGTFGIGSLLNVTVEILASCLLGATVCLVLRCFIPYTDKETGAGTDEKQELEEVTEPDTSVCSDAQLVPLRGATLIAILFAAFMLADSVGEWTNNRVQLEPLLACTVASCLCGHDRGRRHGLEQALAYWTPIVLLPFFTLAGASLQLNGLITVLPGAMALVVLRILSIATGSIVAGCISDRAYPGIKMSSTAKQCSWLTLLAQAGVTLGLVLEVQDKFEGWGHDFGTLVIGVVVLNQLIGPVLCRVGLGCIVKAELESEKNEYAELSRDRDQLLDVAGSKPNIEAGRSAQADDAKDLPRQLSLESSQNATMDSLASRTRVWHKLHD